MANERKTDYFISKLLVNNEIKYTPCGSDIKEIQEALNTSSKKGTGNKGFPEFVAKVKEFILVIENKAELNKQALYDDNEKLKMDVPSIVDYAENGALHYAQAIINKTNFKKVFAFGCSGNETHHKIRPIFVNENGFTILQLVENFENFSEDNIEKYYKEQILKETPNDILEFEDILDKAKIIHEDLRNYGQLGDSEKPLVVSAILLALREESFSIDSLTGDTLKTDGQKIYDTLTTQITRVKVEPETKKNIILNQFTLIKDRPSLNTIEDNLGKTPLKYFAEYLSGGILKSIQANTTEDVLGKFYGEFIKYSGGDGQSLGVVLTPKHITELFCDLVNIQPNDVVFDPCCGTGSFLVAAMNKMLLKANPENVDHIKKEQVFGMEIRPDMFSIATTNMIFRGDGKSNLICDDFLKCSIDDLKKNNFTIGFMNPPYSQGKKGKNTKHLSEINFIKHLLDSMSDNAKCCVIVPQSVMVGNTKDDKLVKQQILKSHTLEGVITLNKETFYSVGTNPCVVVFTANRPHPQNKFCKFINFEDDGYKINKHIGLVETERAKERKIHLLNCWLYDAPAESKFMVKTLIEFEDEWLHSFYYFNDEIPSDEDFDNTIIDYLTFEFNMIAKGRKYLFEKGSKRLLELETVEVVPLSKKEWQVFYLNNIFTSIQRGKRLKKDEHKKGKTPYVSSTAINNGLDGFISNTEKIRMFSKCLSLANSGSVGSSFYQPFDFVASDHVTKLENKCFNKYIYLFISTLVLRLGEKYCFNREINDKRVKREKIVLPVNNKREPDYEYMENFMKNIEIKKLNDYLEFIS